MSMKPIDRELINLAAMKAVQEYKQKFLQNVQEDSEKVMHLTEGHELLEYGKKIAEGWRQTIEDDRVVREQMEREEAEQATRQIEEEIEKQAEGSEAQLQSPAAVKEEVTGRRREKGLPPVLPRTPDDQWEKMVEKWPKGPRRWRSSGSEDTELKVIYSWPLQPEHKVIAGTFGKQPVEEGNCSF